jgi:hypothetical protein
MCGTSFVHWQCIAGRHKLCLTIMVKIASAMVRHQAKLPLSMDTALGARRG